MKQGTLNILWLFLIFIVTSGQKIAEYPDNKDNQSHKYKNGNSYDVNLILAPRHSKVKNVIFMIGDGMSLMHVYSAWTANKGRLFLENCQFTGLSKTYCSDNLITDSAASGTAMATGQKTKKGYVAVGPNGNKLKTITEIARDAGLSTGVIATCRLTDATPATFSVHNTDRDKADEIANSYIDCGIDYIAGGGRSFFSNPALNLNLLPAFEKKGYQVAVSMDDLSKINQGKVFAPVAEIDLDKPAERKDQLWQLTKKGLNLLSENKKGFFLMVESSMIDDYGHFNELPTLMEEILDFDQTIGKVLEWAKNNPGTLVVVTSDHETGGLTLLNGNIETGEIECHFSTKSHSGVMVPVYAFGPKAEIFSGIYENTELFRKISKLLNID